MIHLTIVFVLVDTGEVIAIDDADTISFLNELQRLIDILHLIVVGMRRAVGCQQSVDAEGPQVGLIAEVAAVEK